MVIGASAIVCLILVLRCPQPAASLNVRQNSSLSVDSEEATTGYHLSRQSSKEQVISVEQREIRKRCDGQIILTLNICETKNKQKR